MENGRVMIGVPDIMKKMGIGRDRALEILKSGEFPIKKLGRRYVVHEDVFDKWLRGEMAPTKVQKRESELQLLRTRK